MTQDAYFSQMVGFLPGCGFFAYIDGEPDPLYIRRDLTLHKKMGPTAGSYFATSEQAYELLREYEAMRQKTPTIFENMTDAEKGALLLAKYRGKGIECFYGGVWVAELIGRFGGKNAYRVKPNPEIKTAVMYWNGSAASKTKYPRDTHSITLTVTDGEPDCASIKMVKL